ncbi:MAG: SAM-dependent DNA methyltransferase [Thaumarchaeota archaeon]|nr:SAM-dependent DNA methyltransferase [Nitrososphaerota archaeon]
MSDATENTINDLMAEYLRKHDLNMVTQMSSQLFYGRRQPDFELRNTITLYGEGEWLDSYLDGYNQAIEYGDIAGASGYFLIGYPDQLKDRVRQQRLGEIKPELILSGVEYRGMLKIRDAPVRLFHGQVERIVEWLHKGLTGQKGFEDPLEFVRLMGDVVGRLTEYLPKVGKFHGDVLFEHIIATIPKGKGEIEAARRAAAYLLLNQIVFYRILQASKQDGQNPRYPPIKGDNLTLPKELKQNYFDKVLQDDYQAIFDFDVASLFPQRSLQYIRYILRVIENLQPEQFTRDLLGNIFHRLIPIEVRKPVAAYYTNPMAARLLAKLSIDDPNIKVADFACGSGTLLMAAYDQKAALLRSDFTEQHHRQFIERDLTGVDIMPFAAHLAVVQLALRNPAYWTDKVRIAVYDSTLLRPGSIISSLQKVMPRGQARLAQFLTGETEGSKVQEGALSAAGAGKGFTVESVDLVIMNPPFTRKRHVAKEFRSMLSERFSDYAKRSNKEMNFFAYFILLADRFLKKGGRMGMVLPAAFIQEQSLMGLRQLLYEKYNIEYLILSGWRSAFSEDTSFREILLIARKGVITSILKRTFTAPDAAGDQHQEMMVSSVELDRFSNLMDWRKLIPGEETTLTYPHSNVLSKLGELVPRTIQGIRFHSSSDSVNPKNTLLSRQRPVRTRVEWLILRETEQFIEARNEKTAIEVRVPKNVVMPATRSASGMETIEVTTPYDYVVAGRFRNDEAFWDEKNPSETLRKRLSHIHSREAFMVVAGYGNIDLTSPGTCLLAFVSPFPIVPTWSLWSFKIQSFEKARVLALWWNSTFSLAHLLNVRTEVRGSYMHWGQKAIEETLVLDEDKLDDTSRKKLLNVYDFVCHVQFPSLLDQLRTEFHSRVEIDTALAAAVGWKKYSDLQGLRSLYSDLLVRLEELKLMMGRD